MKQSTKKTSFFKQMKLWQRLTAGFGIMLILLLSLGLYSVNEAHKLSGFTDKLYLHPYTVSTAMLTVEANIIKIDRAMQELMLDNDKDEIKRLLAEIKLLEEKTGKEFDLVEERFLGDKARVLEARQLFESWRPVREEIINFVYTGDFKSAADAAKHKDAPYVENLEESVQYLVDFAHNKATGFMQHADSESEASISTTYNWIAISILLSIGIALLITRSVVRQLGGDPSNLQEVASAMLHGDINSNMAGDKKHIGVFATMLAVHNKMSSQIESDRILVAENNRIKQALDNTTSNVMVADNDYNIIYLNKAVTEMFQDAEKDFRNDLSNFDASKLLGTNIDDFHKNPVHQRGILDKLTSTYTGNLEIGGRHMRIIATPVLDTDSERLGIVVEWLDRTQEVAIENEIQGIVSSAQAGDLSQRIDLTIQEGFTRKLSEGINQLVKVCGETIDETVQVMGAVAQGNLARKIESDYEGSFGQLKNDVNATIEKLTEVMGEINNSATSVLSSSQEIAQGNVDLSQRTEQQASSLEETASSMEEMTSTVRQNADNARQANQLAAGTREQAEQGGEVVNQAVTAMTGITESSNKIAAIIGVIDEIAFQTNLLALNAAVEAARAGEQGRGFAVVASEVRNLAGRSATAAKEIKELIEDSVVKVEEGSKLVDASGQTLDEIMSSVKKVSDIIAEIAAASLEQSDGIEQVNKAIAQMDEMTQQNAALVEEAAAASESMGEQASNLNEMVGFFKTGKSAASYSGVERRKSERPWAGQPAVKAQPQKSVGAPKQQKAVSGSADDSEWEEF